MPTYMTDQSATSSKVHLLKQSFLVFRTGVRRWVAYRSMGDSVITTSLRAYHPSVHSRASLHNL